MFITCNKAETLQSDHVDQVNQGNCCFFLFYFDFLIRMSIHHSKNMKHSELMVGDLQGSF